MEKKTLYKTIKQILAAASSVIIAAPVKLPPKVVAVAKYVALAIGMLEAVDKPTVGDTADTETGKEADDES